MKFRIFNRLIISKQGPVPMSPNKYLDPRKFSRFTIDNGNVVWGKNWDMIFPIEQLHSGVIA